MYRMPLIFFKLSSIRNFYFSCFQSPFDQPCKHIWWWLYSACSFVSAQKSVQKGLQPATRPLSIQLPGALHPYLPGRKPQLSFTQHLRAPLQRVSRVPAEAALLASEWCPFFFSWYDPSVSTGYRRKPKDLEWRLKSNISKWLTPTHCGGHLVQDGRGCLNGNPPLGVYYHVSRRSRYEECSRH